MDGGGHVIAGPAGNPRKDGFPACPHPSDVGPPHRLSVAS